MPRVEHLRRLQEILAVFVRFGFSQAVETSGLVRYLENFKGIFVHKKRIGRLRIGQRLAGAFSELGPTFIKLGQFLSTRPDLIPETIASDLKVLQDRAPPVPYTEIEVVLRRELGDQLETLSRIDPVPLASASIAQVHKALLGNQAVVIKVQRPGIGEQIRADLEILTIFARPLGTIIKQFRPVETVRIFERELKRELDFTNEYRNVIRFKRFFEDDPKVMVPAVYRRLSTPKVLVMDLVEGVRISDLDGIKGYGLDPGTIARQGTDLILRQLFEFGFFHGDPHPGNILVTADGRITLLDFGIVGYLDDKTRDSMAEILIGYLYHDTRRIIYALDDLGVTEGIIDEAGLERDIGELIDRIRNLPISEILIREAIDEIIAIVRGYGLRLPPQLFLLGRSMAMIEDLGLKLDPDFDVLDHLRPYVQGFLRRRYRAERLIKRLSGHWTDISSLLKILPRSLRRILSRMAREEYRFSVDLKGTEPISASIERSVNRLALSIVSAALVVAGAMLSTNPAIRAFLLIIAFILFGLVILGIIRTRRL